MDCSDVPSSPKHSTDDNLQLGNHYVRVFYRIFSLEKPNWEHIKTRDSTIFVRRLQQLKDPSKSQEPPSYWEFNTDGVFYNCTQESIYSTVVGDVIEKLANGHDALIVTFGQTGTGKSVTFFGVEFLSEEYLGLAPRILRNIMMLKNSDHAYKKTTLEMTFIEFAKTAVYDLFREYPNDINMWHASKEARKIPIHSEMDALKELYLGEGRKEVKENNYYSHVNTSVLSFYITVEDLHYSDGHQIEARLHLIDLAGSDTVGNLTCLFKNKREVGAANLTKTSLEHFFLSLIGRSREMMRARKRTNPLIYFLKDDLNINNSLRFIGHIRTTTDLQTTLSMLRFGQMLRGFTPAIKEVAQQKKMSLENKVKYLQRQINELLQERIQNSILLNQDLTTNITSERMAHLQRTIKAYLTNDISEMDMMRVTDINLILNVFREMYNSRETEKQRMSREGSIAIASKRNTESEVSLQKKKGSAKSTSTLNISKSSKEKRRSKRSKDEQRLSLEMVDKEISVQSFFDTPVVKTKPPGLKGTQVKSTPSVFKILKRKRSKFAAVGKKSSLVKKKSANSVIFSNNPDTIQIQIPIPERVPDDNEAWNLFVKEPSYGNFLVECKANEKNISDSYMLYLEEMKSLNEKKGRVNAMKQEILEAKMMIQYKDICSDRCSDTIIHEETINKCIKNVEIAHLLLLEKQEIALRCLCELKMYLNKRKDLRDQLARNFENYCKDKFNIIVPPVGSLSIVEMTKDSTQSTVVDEFLVASKSVEMSEGIESIEMYLKEFKKLMEKERKKVIRLRAQMRKKIYDKPCYTHN